ncbi:MAG TPA: radical SAM family heme chaperone HemW [Blastocatellia bacterium]|nr:radical SAM family heme chaperone HemW [Blastocatellia bacterium]
MQKPAGIYVHIPFCERKCAYCNFNTTDFFDDLAARYVDAVSREIEWWGGHLARERRLYVDTIYFGGGTPSIVEADHLARLVASCRDSFEVAPDAEITIEINPATFERKKLETWLGAGINRASVGTQSFIDRELQSLNRTHTADDARRTVELLREAGFQNISLDLIAGLPAQTLDDWQFNLEAALKIRPEHMSLYLLEVKEGTQLFAQIERGLRPRPDDDLAARMYRVISEATRGAGYEHYEISNFALAPDPSSETGESPFRSKHNMKYWTAAPFYGMGCGAHSYDARARWFNILKTEKYIEQVAATGQGIASRHELSSEDRAAEALFMGLRLKEGISLDGFRDEHGVDVERRYGHELPRLADAGLIEIANGRMMLTEAGRLLSNEVFVSFV